MLGKIIGIKDNTVMLSLNAKIYEIQNIINLYVMLEDKAKKIIGEIVDIKDNVAYINLIGEFQDDKFIFGIASKPSFSSDVKLVSKEKANLIIGMGNSFEGRELYVGKSPIYDGVNIGVDINNFFSNHFAIFGSTGSGKSCSIARIFQNLFSRKESIAYRASIILFDAYGEYHQAFSKLHEINNQINFKTYTTNVHDNSCELVKLPIWLLSLDDIALLLEANSNTELPIIEKALKYVSVFARNEEDVIKSKNDIIARALLDILTSGKEPGQIRDQIFSVLSHYKTKDLNLDTPIYQPGYTRPLKQCLLIDQTGKIREMELLTTFISEFLNDDIELSLPDGSFKYTLDDLYKAFEFALISEGIFSSERVYDNYNSLKVKLRTLKNSEYSKFFDDCDFITLNNFVKSILTIDNKKAQIINFNINYVDDRFAKTITKIYSRILFEYSKSLKVRTGVPIHIILEEAHRYVQNDRDIDIIGYNIFDRITKEGRKYAILLGLISQRPSELSETALSQCSNFLIFRMMHPKDISYISQIIPSITSEIIKKLKLLQPGNCVAFGTAFKLPVLVKLDMPNPSPSSSNCDIINTWFVNKN